MTEVIPAFFMSIRVLRYEVQRSKAVVFNISEVQLAVAALVF
jgi:hypothetical protein